MSIPPNGSQEPPASVVLTPDEWASLPSEVYVPIASASIQDEQVQLVLREIGDAGQALPVYSSLAALAASCGAEQAWMSINSSRIPYLAIQAEFGTVLVDTAMPEPAPAGSAAQGYESAQSHGDLEPTMLYAPSRAHDPGDETVELELQPIVGDQLALVVFSSLELLHAGCGPYQLWASFRADLLEDVRRSTGADVVFKDRALPEHVRHGPSAAGRSRTVLSETGHGGSPGGGERKTGVQHTTSRTNGNGMQQQWGR